MSRFRYHCCLVIGLMIQAGLFSQNKDSLLQNGEKLLQEAKIRQDSTLFAEAYLNLGKAHFFVDNQRAYDYFSKGSGFRQRELLL